ncbi:3-deoxy-manno-octulosonate cytidylyltransferase [Congregibacter litoralis]|uniref:3-deoxy-manno-octulosonate cytidylyltransferase n=1 Tax=Congregibacter litoralis KT71 TaxID=314285 RepID=A4A8A8_9GAMM|nr:3-deoxy-manno-octulosonate cytidylyltransferase [Congregibacter litoralis]EAQ97903.1 3-deoxy-D-manno-octulosonate cytidylyltransferase [Congregibacter litoralis KT71]
MSFIVVIPARYASTRLPGKPLSDIAGKSMLQHVWERAGTSAASEVVIATDDERIEAACADFGARCLMTRADHASGTDRLAEVVEQLGLTEKHIVVNVQGDEPLIPSAVIDQVAGNLQRNPSASMATLCEVITDATVLRDTNAVKVVFDENGRALYFSRATIPWPRDHEGSDGEMPEGQWHRHIGIYAYRAGFLKRYSQWQPAPLELTESLEQLRALYKGESIHVEPACAAVPGGIDTPADLDRVRGLFAQPRKPGSPD